MDEKKISCFDRIPPYSSKYAWFVAQNIEDHCDEILFTMPNPMYQYQCRIPELQGRLICTFHHGWAILSKHSDTDAIFSLWNPNTSEFISFPPLQGDTGDICLSSPPGDPGSVLLVTGEEEPTITFCPIHNKRKKLKWSKMSYAKQLRSIIKQKGLFLLDCFSCYNSKVYALIKSPNKRVESIIQVDITVVKGKVVISLLPFLEGPTHSYIMRPLINKRLSFSRRPPSMHLLSTFTTDRFLKGSCTELFFIEIGYEDLTRNTIIDVYLFKLDVASMTWKEMEDLKDDIFFIDISDDGSVFYKSAVSSEAGGYIHIFDSTREIMYSYHVKDRTISLSRVPSLVETSIVSMLEFRLEYDHADSKQEEEEDRSNEIVVRPVTDCEGEFNNTTDESHLLNIPFDLLQTMMEFCVGEEYMKFRASCKQCHLAAPLIQSRLQTFSFVSPWLIMLDKHQGFITFMDPIFGDKYFIKTPQELINVTYILCYGFGWLLMIKRGGSLVFFNPFTREIRELPHSPESRLESCWFSAPPSSPDCMLVGFDSFGSEAYIHFIAREPRGRTVDLVIHGDNPFYFVFPTYHEGNLYALCNEGELYIFRHFGEGSHSWGPVGAKTPQSRCGSKPQYFQVKCDEYLLLVIVGKFGESVEVFKLNDSKKEWEKIDGLGKHTIYIGDMTCVCTEAKTPEMENKIYFPRLHNGMLVFYSLETCTYNTFNGKDSAEYFRDFMGTTHHCYPRGWIEPSWS